MRLLGLFLQEHGCVILETKYTPHQFYLEKLWTFFINLAQASPEVMGVGHIHLIGFITKLSWLQRSAFSLHFLLAQKFLRLSHPR